MKKIKREESTWYVSLLWGLKHPINMCLSMGCDRGIGIPVTIVFLPWPIGSIPDDKEKAEKLQNTAAAVVITILVVLLAGPPKLL